MEYPSDKFVPEIVKLLNNGHTVTLPVRGNSMRPLLKGGRDKILISKPTEINIGDIVLAYIPSHRYVLHRIIKKSPNKILLLGDANITPEQCSYNDIKGKAVGFYSSGQTLRSMNSTKLRPYSYVWTKAYRLRILLLLCLRRIRKKAKI